MKMGEIAKCIDAHLKRMEADKTINVETSRDPYTPKGQGLRRFFGAQARYYGGRKLAITYISYQGSSYLTKTEANAYLAALNRGSTDRHHEVLRELGTRSA